MARLRVLSNHRVRWMEGHLGRLGLRDHFERVLVSEAIGPQALWADARRDWVAEVDGLLEVKTAL